MYFPDRLSKLSSLLSNFALIIKINFEMKFGKAMKIILLFYLIYTQIDYSFFITFVLQWCSAVWKITKVILFMVQWFLFCFVSNTESSASEFLVLIQRKKILRSKLGKVANKIWSWLKNEFNIRSSLFCIKITFIQFVICPSMKTRHALISSFQRSCEIIIERLLRIKPNNYLKYNWQNICHISLKNDYSKFLHRNKIQKITEINFDNKIS